jgi:hypothetical protein
VPGGPTWTSGTIFRSPELVVAPDDEVRGDGGAVGAGGRIPVTTAARTAFDLGAFGGSIPSAPTSVYRGSKTSCGNGYRRGGSANGHATGIWAHSVAEMGVSTAASSAVRISCHDVSCGP